MTTYQNSSTVILEFWYYPSLYLVTCSAERVWFNVDCCMIFSVVSKLFDCRRGLAFVSTWSFILEIFRVDSRDEVSREFLMSNHYSFPRHHKCVTPDSISVSGLAERYANFHIQRKSVPAWREDHGNPKMLSRPSQKANEWGRVRGEGFLVTICCWEELALYLYLMGFYLVTTMYFQISAYHIPTKPVVNVWMRMVWVYSRMLI